MNVVVSGVTPRSRTAVRAHPDVLAVVVVALVAVALTAFAWETWGDLGSDTGYDFVAATHVAHGQLPYADFVYYYGPLAPFALGLAAFLGGATVTTFAAVGIVVTYAIVALTYALARTQVGPLGAAIASIATAAVAFSPTNLSYVAPHTYSVTFAIALSLVFLLGLSAAANGSSAGSLVAGVAAGGIALTRPEFEAAAVAAGLVWLVVRRRAGLPVRPHALRLGLPAIGVPVAVYGAYLASMSPHRLFLENLYPIDTLRAGGNAIVKLQAPMTAHSFAVVIGYLLVYCCGLAAMAAAARILDRYGRPAATYAVIGLTTAAVPLIAAVDPEAVRSKLAWVFGGAPAAAALASVALLVLVFRTREVTPRTQTLLAAVVLLAVVAAKTYRSFFFLSHIPQPAVYSAPFVFVALARLHMVDPGRNRTLALWGTAWVAALALVCAGLTVKDVRAQSATVSGPGGSLRVSPPEAPLYRSAVGAILGATRPGEPILVAPQLTSLYTITERTDPLPEISLVPGALPSRRDESRAIAQLDRSQVRLVLTDRHAFPEYGQTRFGMSFDRLLSRWIRRHFVHTAVLRPSGGVDHVVDVWMRRKS